LNATGDVVRTTPLLHKLAGEVTWITALKNVPLVDGIRMDLRCVAWEQRDAVRDTRYDLVINLEDEAEVSAFAATLEFSQLFGAYLTSDNVVSYTDDARQWFDMSLISRYGRKRADELKLANRRSYQEIIFEGLGLRFDGEPYLVPQPKRTALRGDVAVAPFAGPVWPMKNWAHYDQLMLQLEELGLRVNVLPFRESLLEHLGDIGSHRCVVGGDSLPMHLALGAAVPCVTLFNCTSPWEIYDYGLLVKLTSPLLAEYFYKRGHDPRATEAIRLAEVKDAVLSQLETTVSRG
jgi:heptosyltransferase-2